MMLISKKRLSLLLLSFSLIQLSGCATHYLMQSDRQYVFSSEPLLESKSEDKADQN
jgi:hypothetical protein